MGFKKFVVKLLLFLPLGLAAIGVSYIVDPWHLMKGKQYYRKNARMLLSGKCLGNTYSLGPIQRILKASVIEAFDSKRQVVVLGSSRTQGIRAESFPSLTFFNNSLSGAGIEDSMCTYWMYRKKKILPSVVVFGVDPWIVNKDNRKDFFEVTGNEYTELMGCLSGVELSQKPVFLDSYESYSLGLLFSPTYFKMSLRRLPWYISGGRNDLYEVSGKNNQGWILHPDGSLVNYEAAGNGEMKKVETDSERMAMADELIGEFQAIEKTRFEKFSSLIIKDKVRLMFYLPPFSPATYKLLLKAEKYKIIKEVQSYFEDYARKNKVEIRGSYDPAYYGLTEADFEDGFHAKWESIKKKFEQENGLR